jgi:N-acetylglucosaminyldiphosphoundecaprenol N-acetyl-beta-D-mannosaminyltransferase
VTDVNDPLLPEIPKVWVWGVPISRVTLADAITVIDQLVESGRPHFVVTANLHYAMLSASDQRLRINNEKAALILPDGMPLVWASRWRSQPLPERVTGSDLLPMLCARLAKCGYGIYLLGAAPGVATEAAKRMIASYPGLRIVGVQSPPFRELSDIEQQSLVDEIRNAKPHLLVVAMGQPKGEYWVADWYERLGVPVVIQVGAAIDFAAGRISRAPWWMQRAGLEWCYRFMREPFRLGGRYAANTWFAMTMLLRDLVTPRDRRS